MEYIGKLSLYIFIFHQVFTPLIDQFYNITNINEFWLFTGFLKVDLGDKQAAFIATPEKSLLDLVYLTPESDSRAYIEELRLQNLDRLNMKDLLEKASDSRSPKLMRAAKLIVEFVSAEDYEDL